MLANHLGVLGGSEDLRVLMVKQVAAVLEKLLLSCISDGMALNATLNDFGFILSTAQLRLPFLFAIPPVCTLCFLSIAVQNQVEGPKGITLRQHFCATNRTGIKL